MKLYAIRDDKSEAFGPVLMFRADGEAIRACMDAVGGKDATIAAHPQDFTLYGLAEYDDAAGVIHAVAQPRYVVRLSDLKEVV